MSGPLKVLGHHSETIDPTLWNWIRHQIDAITDLSPATIVVAIGVVIGVIPVVLMALAARRRRRMVTRD